MCRTSHRHARLISRSVSDVANASLSEEIAHDEDDDVEQISPAFSSPHLADADDRDNVFNDADDGANFSGFDSAHYRGFLLRHGSYERYKIRAGRKRDPLEAETKGVCTLPRCQYCQTFGNYFYTLVLAFL